MNEEQNQHIYDMVTYRENRKLYIKHHWEKAKRNVSKASRATGLNRTTFYEKLVRLGLVERVKDRK